MERAVRNCKETIIREASQDHEIMGMYPLFLTWQIGDVQISNISMFRSLLEEVGIKARQISQIVGNLEKTQRSTGDIKIDDIRTELVKARVSKDEIAIVIDKLADYPGFGTFKPRDIRR